MSEIRICNVCHSKYKYCPNCRQYAGTPGWKVDYCSENCRDIFRTCSLYVGKTIDIEEAYKRLSVLNTDFDIMLPGVARNVKEIMEYKKGENNVS